MSPHSPARPLRYKLAWLAPALIAALVALALLPTAQAVKRHDFKTCAQSGFCRRNRAVADRAAEHGKAWNSPYEIAASPDFARGSLSAPVSNALFPGIKFRLDVDFHQDGTARVRMDEVDGLRQRYNEAAKWALEVEPQLDTADERFDVRRTDASTSVKYAGGRNELRIDHKPLTLTFLRDGEPQMVLNDRRLFNMEHFRVKTVGEQPDELVVQDPEHPEQQRVVVPDEAFPGFLPPDEDGMWEETFAGKKDSKPKGPESLSVDISFPGFEHVFGIPEHASSLSLKETRGGDGAYSDPYRLYNLDVFEYEADSEMALYGSIPFMQAHRPGSSVGIFLATGSEAWIDITKSSKPRQVSTHWMAESGILDLFVFLGPTPQDIISSYTRLTGLAPLPRHDALGYHQCRWNYLDERDVQTVSQRFDEADISMDTMWLDVEYAIEKRYMTWDPNNFPTPATMQDKLAERGRNLVAIVDPHLKRDDDYYVYKEAKELDILCKQPDGKTELEGWCWPGSSSWVDWFNPTSHDWWIKMFRFDKFKPSVFNGPEITMQKDAVHYGGWEHRDIHNINGMIYQNLTMQGLIEREDPPKRPFVLTRAYYAGSQRFGAMWTGDNLGDWEHLKSTVPMLLSNAIAGMSFTGSDVGGFFGDPTPEMMVRWHQIGAFSPFFRAHGHIDTKRREAYLYEQPYQGMLRDAIRLRYSLLPAFYTAFYEYSLSGAPVIRPQYVVFPNDPKGFGLDHQFYLGSSGLLVKPVEEEGATTQEVYVSDDQPYYHYLTHEIYFGASHGGASVKVPAPLESIPVLQRGGHILPRHDLIRRASKLAWKDPITLVVAVDLSGTSANGTLYLDDGETFDHQQGDFVLRSFSLAPQSQKKGDKSLMLRNRAGDNLSPAYDASNAYARKIADVTVREIVVLGLPSKPSCVKIAGESVGLEFEWKDGASATGSRRSSGKGASALVIKDAASAVISDWDLVFDFDARAACTSAPAIDYDAQLASPECSAGKFLCRNEGHLPSCILRSRVNDGVCDSECCDGSDETDGKALCPNRCKAVGEQYRKDQAEAERKLRVGASIRADYIKYGAKEKLKLEQEVERVHAELETVRRREEAAKAALEALENAEAGEIERKKNSQLYERTVEMQKAIKALRLHRHNLEGHIDDLSGIMTDLARTFNPNHQDMAVLGAVRAHRDWQKANGIAIDDTVNFGDVDLSDEAEESSTPLSKPSTEDEEDVVDYADDELKKLEDEDPLSLIDSINLRVGSPVTSGVANIFKVDDYIPDKWRPTFDGYKKQLVDLLVRAGIINVPSSSVDSSAPELLRARSTHSSLVDEARSVEGKLTSAQQALEKDWGRDWEWKKLENECVEKNTGEYTYSVCFLGEATQKSNNNGQRTSLGRFESWAPNAEPGTDAYYLKQVYANGQRCWNGPLRSAKVDLVCGTSNALLSVIEPEKCEYLFEVTTPAVCFPPEEKEQKEVVKDEL
ncbi:hypothetical protein Rhopal_003725-T1 [Rhodotorula paludigena]|uniref:Glucosidase 2 subunit beta n=1 Tax=Rhodotorula paludigena TaxID=86838 RepID=A0AAV5GEA2_9BASI|nr:hypothetical protein Rhopal_003725-T1 [Rhodotorula paludigena]